MQSISWLGKRTSRISWHEDQASWDASMWAFVRQQDEEDLQRQPIVRAWCDFCSARSVFGSGLDGGTNLRESLECAKCGLINRLRLLYSAMVETNATPIAGPFYLLEQLSAFCTRLETRFGRFTASEYVPDAGPSGTIADVGGFSVTHQDIMSTSFDDDSFVTIVHAEVLEHVSDHQAALAEIFRILRPGGVTLFTVPFMETRASNLLRAVLDHDGDVRHVLPPEVHGNPIDSSGSLVFQIFGWELLDELRAAGFSRCEAGFISDPRRAITNGVVFRARNGDVGYNPKRVHRRTEDMPLAM
jgi:SAM-dependent methyltransferase